MSDLRRKAASRLAQSSSRRTPLKASTTSSRVNTDDEADYDDDFSMLSDDDDWSVASGDTLDSYGTDSETNARSSSRSAKRDVDTRTDWREKLSGYIDTLSGERKNTSYSSREDALSRISKIVSIKYAWRIIEERHKDLEDGIIRSLKNAKSDKEIILACRVLSLLVITDPENETWYTGTVSLLQNLIFGAESSMVKVSCLYALGSVLFFSAVAGDHERRGVLEFLMDIVTTDGSSIQAADDEPVVTATIQVFGLLASTLDDALELSQDAVPALVDQLESSKVSVRVASGQVIALLYERYVEDIGNYHVIDSSDEEDGEEEIEMGAMTKSPEPVEDDDENESENESEGEEEVLEPPVKLMRPKPVRTDSSRPTLYYDEEQLVYLLTQLASASTKRLAKSSRKVQHSMFRDILETVKNAIGGADRDTMGLEGSITSLSSAVNSNIHLTLKFEQGLVLAIDSWAAFLRLAHVRRVLSHGLPAHYSRNRVVRIALDPLGSITYERSRSSRMTPAEYPSDEEGQGNPDQTDPSMKEFFKGVNRESKKMRDEDIRKARSKGTKELFNRELADWESTQNV
ncbi:interferon-related developmental regulator-domain-containing protein [Lipomyces arxii]|uniref:interferon-related developmental regulator-domain-containing protein n=1 Tax=Lipomyces arxii TaxID=56418 RepID=UPI0034CEC08E